jgi:hypothetical protein
MYVVGARPSPDTTRMAMVSLLWLVVAPLGTGYFVAHSPRGNRFVARCYWPCLAVGWIGVALLVVGGVLLHGPLGTLAVFVGAPLAGLSFWSRRDGDGGGEPPDDDPDPMPPDWDWERFYSDLRDFTDARGRPRGGDREPSAV